ncbi:MAG: hypothetical protein MUD01_02910 [Chloroflexaceae bacterium]|nr:hypothetical protein [Chloroflexaceae bacterium]
MIAYTCRHEMLPIVEAALAANGYTVELLLSPHQSGVSMVLMKDRDCSVLLSHSKPQDEGQIEIWGAAQTVAGLLLETLPLQLEKQSYQASSSDEGQA